MFRESFSKCLSGVRVGVKLICGSDRDTRHIPPTRYTRKAQPINVRDK